MGFKYYKLRSFMTLEQLAEFFGRHNLEVETHFNEKEQPDRLVVSDGNYFFLEQFESLSTKKTKTPSKSVDVTGKIVVAHTNTELTILDNPSGNEEVAWMVLHKTNGEKVHFFPQQNTLPAFIKDGVCQKKDTEICNLGYACDGCPYNPEVN